MKLKYDFHIHSALSPCALDEMTPNNIYNMSLIMELDAIAVTDHNSARNIKAINELNDNKIIIIPGMEVESKEEIHIVCLFLDENSVYNMQNYVYEHLPKRKNKPSVLGRQLVLNSEDDVIEEEEKLLSFATSLSFEEILEYTASLGGIAIPAHIDRPSYSVISNLGILPEHPLLTSLEVSQYADYEKYKEEYGRFKVIQSSDAHELGFIGICNRYLEVKEKSISSIFEALKN